MKTTQKYGGCPWQEANYIYGNGIIGLHEEIEHFYRYTLPTPSEHAVRVEAVKRIECVIHELWPEALVEIFGSFRIGLYLPNSDIDLVLMGQWDRLPLHTLELELLRRGIARAGTSQVLDMATVPIIRFTDSQTQIKIDLSFNMPNGVNTAEMIKEFVRDFPAMGKLVLVLKQFLAQRNLNYTFCGGISSYTLLLMCISFLQLHPRHISHQTTNLGVLLLEFFELYGINFNYEQLGICIRQGGYYVCKEHMHRDAQLSTLYIEDPLEPGNATRRCQVSIDRIKQAFQWAYRVLSLAVLPQDSSETQIQLSSASSILGKTVKPFVMGGIIQITDEDIKHRAWLRKKFDHLVVVEPISPLYGQINGAVEYVTLESGAIQNGIQEP